MNDTKKAASFRSSIGGFNKSDVVDFITEENKKFASEKNALEEKLKEANDRIAELTQKLEEAESSNFILNVSKEEAEENFKKDASEAQRRVEAAENAAAVLEAKLTQALSDVEEANSQRDAATSERDEAIDNIKTTIEESTRLRALVDGCTEQIEKYTDRIAELESSLSTIKSGSGEDRVNAEKFSAENEFLRRKYTELAEKFKESSDYITELEGKITELNGELEKANEISRVTENAAPSKMTLGEVSDVSEKAIDAIRAINHEVKGYMDDCVGEFDSYSRDINDSISKLLEDIGERCRQLDEKIKYHRESVSKNIDSHFTDFEN